MREVKCRFCGQELEHVFIDLGMSPIANNLKTIDQLAKPEPFIPLKVYVCDACKLVQVDEVEIPSTFFNDHYTYFSSYSKFWLDHARTYTEMMIETFQLDSERDFIVEVGSNDGYLLQYFLEDGFDVLGVEPSTDTAEVAISKGIHTETFFFGDESAQRIVKSHGKAKLIICNNVLAHVPDINDFCQGLKDLLHEEGMVTIEFPHLVNLIDNVEFDTIYHEHYSYLSLIFMKNLVAAHGLEIFKVDQLTTHGGSLRLYLRHEDYIGLPIDESVENVYNVELEHHLDSLEGYLGFKEKVIKVKHESLKTIIRLKEEGKRIAAFGAPAKGNTFLNYCGFTTVCFDFTVDDTPIKQNKFLPGTNIPVYSRDKLYDEKPDYIFILPWNHKEEIMEKIADTKAWGAKFITAIPELKIYD